MSGGGPDADYEYRGLVAATWDLLRGDTAGWPDRAFYFDLIRRSGEPALDVGCGTGRLLLDYLEQGIDVDGVDVSPDMLTLCRAKARQRALQPTVFLQAIESLDLPRRYRTIIVPSSTFQLLTDPPAATRAMERLFAHLQPGGVLAMPFMILWKPGDSRATEWRLIVERARPEDGAVVRRWSRADYDAEGQLEHTEDRFEVTLRGAVIAAEHHRRSPATRWYTRAQAEALFAQAGFVDRRVYHEFTWQPAAEGDVVFTMLGTRPGGASLP